MNIKRSNQRAEHVWLGEKSIDSVAQNLVVVSRIWDEIWNKGALEACDEVFTEDYVGHLPIMIVHGPDGFKNLVKVYLTAFPDVHLTVEDAFGAGDRVTVRWISRGTHLGAMMGVPPSQNKIEVMGISIFRMAGGQVAEEWEGFDTLGMMQQIGAIPTPGKDSEESMTIETNKAILGRHFNEVLNQGHLEVIDEIYTSDYTLDAPVRSDGNSQARGIIQGREQLKKRVLLFRTGFPDIHFDMDEIIGEKDAVVVRYTFRGTHLGLFAGVEPNGCSIAVPGILVAHLIAGKIHEAFSAFDSAELMKQLNC